MRYNDWIRGGRSISSCSSSAQPSSLSTSSSSWLPSKTSGGGRNKEWRWLRDGDWIAARKHTNALPTLLPSRLLSLLLFVVAAAELPTIASGTIPKYYASNCYEVGGGNMGPLYLKCAGCQYTEAFDCLDTLRANTSNNVPTGCGINMLTVQPDPTCCPVFEDPNNQRSVDSSTSAYPDALLCLENAGCKGDNLHTGLSEECVFNQCHEPYACVATYSGAGQPSPSALGVGIAVGLGLLVARIPLAGPCLGD